MHESVRLALENANARYRIRYHYDLGRDIACPADFAGAMNYEVGRVTKTLLVRPPHRPQYALIVAGSNQRVAFDRVAAAHNVTRLRMASREELAAVLQYPPTGVSPLGSAIPVFVDQNLLGYETILIGSGVIAAEIELSPTTLVEVTRAVVMQLAHIETP